MDYLFNISEKLSELMSEKEIGNQSLADEIDVCVTTVRGWRRGAKYMRINDLIKVANFFDCTLEYIVGRSERQMDYIAKECPKFYTRLREVMAERGVSAYQMGKETNIKDSYLSKWKNGQNVHLLTLIDIANYLGVTLDYLVGRDR